jgi:putative SOS response-associated peptidase YedK
MYGRYVRAKSERTYARAAGLHDWEDAHQYLGDISPDWNIAPTKCSKILRHEFGRPQFVSLRWGLVPFWAKDCKGKVQPINAQCETAAEKPMFRKLIRERRCLVAADGFYEWKKTPAGKVPHYITHAGGEPFFFAGLWDCWRQGKADELQTFTILTGKPNELVAGIHDRMAVIVRPEHYGLWLDPDVRDPQALGEMLASFPAEEMRAIPVSTRVNSSKNNDAELIEAVFGATV